MTDDAQIITAIWAANAAYHLHEMARRNIIAELRVMCA